MKTELEMAKEGEVLREYGKTHFLAVSEAVDIGRFKWNMVPIGKKGQGDIIFYLTTEQMLALCTEILNGKFAEKIAADKGTYPKAYAYMTGEDGSLHLAIGGGNVGCRIQMRNLKAKPQLNYTMAVSMESMNTMARKYMLCTGMTPVAPGSYYASVISAFEEGRGKRAQFRKPSDEEVGDSVDSNSVVDESAVEAAEAETVAANETKTEANPVEKKDTSKETKQEEAVATKDYALTLHGPKTIKKGFYVFDGFDEEKNKISLMFRKDDADKLGWFKKFENAVSLGDTTLKINGERRDNFILYKGPAVEK
jgi:hypothetical protein